MRTNESICNSTQAMESNAAIILPMVRENGNRQSAQDLKNIMRQNEISMLVRCQEASIKNYK